MIVKSHPKKDNRCVFCNNWIGDAKMKFVNTSLGYEYDDHVLGTCTKKNCSKHAGNLCRDKYEPSMDAKRLL